jgi:hypothetical protein
MDAAGSSKMAVNTYQTTGRYTIESTFIYGKVDTNISHVIYLPVPLMVAVCTTYFNIKKLCILPKLCVSYNSQDEQGYFSLYSSN